MTSWSVDRRMAGSFDLVNAWTAEDEVVIVDAMYSGGVPGTILRFDMHTERVPSCMFSSTHSFGPMEIAELARSLDRLPRSLVVIGIEVGTTEHGAELSPAVADAVARLAWELEHARSQADTGSALTDRAGRARRAG